jgi:hypothetical protein
LPAVLPENAIVAVEVPMSGTADFDTVINWLRRHRKRKRPILAVVSPDLPHLKHASWSMLRRTGAGPCYPDHYDTNWSIAEKQRAIAEHLAKLWARIDAASPKRSN